jgi:hypothetical protein
VTARFLERVPRVLALACETQRLGSRQGVIGIAQRDPRRILRRARLRQAAELREKESDADDEGDAEQGFADGVARLSPQDQNPRAAEDGHPRGDG